MTLQEKINEDLKKALKSKEEPLLGTLRLVKADIQYELTKTGASSLPDTSVLQILKSNYKKRKDTAEEYDRVGRSDLANAERNEAKVIEAYIPEEVSLDEISSKAKSIIETLGAKGPSDLGKVMGKVMGEFKGQNIDGNKVSSVVKELLASIN